MAILPIAIYPAPVLTTRAQPVETITPTIVHLLDDMADTMYSASGIGLAGPQIFQNLRMIVIDVGEPVAQTSGARADNMTHKLYQLVNPEIVSQDGSIVWEEGCLSLPDLHVDMKRSNHVVVRAQDKTGTPLTIDAHGLLAVALQHEIDHLNGILIFDALSRLKRQLYLRKLRKLASE